MEGVADTVRAIDNRVAGVDDRVAGVDDRVASVSDRVVTVDDRVMVVDNKVTEVIAGPSTLYSITMLQSTSPGVSSKPPLLLMAELFRQSSARDP